MGDAVSVPPRRPPSTTLANNDWMPTAAGRAICLFPARNNGKGARLLAAALHAGCTVELVHVWYGQQARTLEQRLKQRRKPGSLRAGAARNLKPLCPVCNPYALRRYLDLPDAPTPRRHRFVHDPVVWDADAEWGGPGLP